MYTFDAMLFLVILGLFLHEVDLQAFSLKDPDRNTGAAYSNADLENQLLAAKTKRLNLQKQVKTLQDEATNLITTAEALTNTTTYLAAQAAAQPPWPLAFEATLASDVTYHDQGQMAVFSDVVTNVGFEYDTSTGYFYCKRSGIYLFAITLYADGSAGDATVDVYLNNVVVARPFTGKSQDRVGSSGVAIGKARQGDELRVQFGIFNSAVIRKETRLSAVFIHEFDW